LKNWLEQCLGVVEALLVIVIIGEVVHGVQCVVVLWSKSSFPALQHTPEQRLRINVTTSALVYPCQMVHHGECIEAIRPEKLFSVRYNVFTKVLCFYIASPLTQVQPSTVICQKKYFCGFPRSVLPQGQRLDMRDNQLASRPPFMRLDILNLPECGTHELYSELEQSLDQPTAPRVLQDNELNEVMYAESWGLGASVICHQTTGLEVSDGILACDGGFDLSEE
jgi:hypothetical protein